MRNVIKTQLLGSDDVEGLFHVIIKLLFYFFKQQQKIYYSWTMLIIHFNVSHLGCYKRISSTNMQYKVFGFSFMRLCERAVCSLLPHWLQHFWGRSFDTFCAKQGSDRSRSLLITSVSWCIGSFFRAKNCR